MKLKIYGCRGSVPIAHSPASVYGGNTSCIVIESMGYTFVLDAGSGLSQYEADLRTQSPSYMSEINAPVDILLSHLHLDHIIGLTTFSPIWGSSAGARIFTCLRGKGSLKEQVFGAFVPPYWPCSMVEEANVSCIPIMAEDPLVLGPLTITPFGAVHPDATLSFHITDGKSTLVHLLDSETGLMAKKDYSQLIEYCRDADLVVFDAAYSPEDYPEKKGWGHSTIEDGFKLAGLSDCKNMLFSHFSFEYSDEALAALEARVKVMGSHFRFARDGLEIDLV